MSLAALLLTTVAWPERASNCSNGPHLQYKLRREAVSVGSSASVFKLSLACTPVIPLASHACAWTTNRRRRRQSLNCEVDAFSSCFISEIHALYSWPRASPYDAADECPEKLDRSIARGRHSAACATHDFRRKWEIGSFGLHARWPKHAPPWRLFLLKNVDATKNLIFAKKKER